MIEPKREQATNVLPLSLDFDEFEIYAILVRLDGRIKAIENVLREQRSEIKTLRALVERPRL